MSDHLIQWVWTGAAAGIHWEEDSLFCTGQLHLAPKNWPHLLTRLSFHHHVFLVSLSKIRWL
jgi:hypothetical protein